MNGSVCSRSRWAPGHADKMIRRLELNVFPWIGARAVKAITAPEMLAVLRRIETRGANETVHRTLQVCGRVFRFAVAMGRASSVFAKPQQSEGAAACK